MTLIHPTVHLNGTSKNELLQGYVEALRALRAAEAAIAKAGPHARDYYVQGDDAFRQAQAQHVHRLLAIDNITGELEAIAEKLAGV